MSFEKRLLAVVILASVCLIGCGGNNNNASTSNPATGNSAASNPSASKPATAPLPDGGFKANIAITNPPTTVKVGETFSLNAKVKNAGNAVWPSVGQSDAKFQVGLGNHWLDADGKMVTLDDGRAYLKRDLNAGEEVDLQLTAKAPANSGEYILEVDMLQEHIAWFKEKGSATFKTKVIVEK